MEIKNSEITIAGNPYYGLYADGEIKVLDSTIIIEASNDINAGKFNVNSGNIIINSNEAAVLGSKDIEILGGKLELNGDSYAIGSWGKITISESAIVTAISNNDKYSTIRNIHDGNGIYLNSSISVKNNSGAKAIEGKNVNLDEEVIILGDGYTTDGALTIKEENGISYFVDKEGNSVSEVIIKKINQPESPIEPDDKPDHNWVYRPSYNDSKDEEVKEYTTAEKSKACVELLGKGWAYSESNKSCVYTLDTNTQQIPNTSTK